MKTKQQLFEDKVRQIVKEELMKENMDKTNALLKLNIRTNKDGSVEIFSQGQEITLPTVQHVQWLKNNL